jgi:hypothetical protein
MSILEAILAVVVAVGAGKVGVGWLLKRDTAKEERRRGAAKMAQRLAEFGLTTTADFLTDYSVGDYSSMAAKLKNVASTFLAGPGAVEAEFAQIFDRVFQVKLQSESGRALIAAKLQDAIQGSDPTIVRTAPPASVN